MKNAMMITAASVALAAGSAYAAESEEMDAAAAIPAETETADDTAVEENGAESGFKAYFDKSMTWLKTDTYVGINYGTTSADVSPLDIISNLPAATAVSVGIDDSDSGYRLYFGKRFMPHFAVELGYQDLGEIDINVSGDTLNVPAYLQQLANNTPVAPSGITIDAVTEWTIADFGMEGGEWTNDLSVHGRLGLFMWETEVEYTSGGVTYSNDDDGTDIRFGVGAGWKFNENFSARFDYEMNSATTDVDMISLGAVYSF